MVNDYFLEPNITFTAESRNNRLREFYKKRSLKNMVQFPGKHQQRSVMYLGPCRTSVMELFAKIIAKTFFG